MFLFVSVFFRDSIESLPCFFGFAFWLYHILLFSAKWCSILFFSYLSSCFCFSLSLSGIHCNESRKNSESNLFSRYPQEIFLILTNTAPKNKKIYLLPQKKNICLSTDESPHSKSLVRLQRCRFETQSASFSAFIALYHRRTAHKSFTMSSVFHQIVVLCKKTFHLLELLGVFSPADTMQRIAFSFYMLPFWHSQTAQQKMDCVFCHFEMTKSLPILFCFPKHFLGKEKHVQRTCFWSCYFCNSVNRIRQVCGMTFHSVCGLNSIAVLIGIQLITNNQ